MANISMLRAAYQAALPAAARDAVWRLRHWSPARNLWLRRYTAFGLSERERIFLLAAQFLHRNRPMNGCYFEFGCYGANTMRLAWKHTRHLFDWTYVAFDSFEGLPEIGEIDRQNIWAKGKLAMPEEEFRRLCRVPENRLIAVKGFYKDSLTPALRLPGKAAMIYIDCDLYESTVPVLEFCKSYLQRGTIIVFDDWNCFHADPEKGERRAWREFTGRNPTLRFEPLVSTAEAQGFVFLG
jgi:hypothetical protein